VWEVFSWANRCWFASDRDCLSGGPSGTNQRNAFADNETASVDYRTVNQATKSGLSE
jgi:hypothetical protein